MRKRLYAFVKSHNLVNRIYDTINYFGLIKHYSSEIVIKKFIFQRLEDADYVETLAKYFEGKMKCSKKNAELRCNLRDLIYDLENLKMYLL